jgi:hypothetical protein
MCMSTSLCVLARLLSMVAMRTDPRHRGRDAHHHHSVHPILLRGGVRLERVRQGPHGSHRQAGRLPPSPGPLLGRLRRVNAADGLGRPHVWPRRARRPRALHGGPPHRGDRHQARDRLCDQNVRRAAVLPRCRAAAPLPTPHTMSMSMSMLPMPRTIPSCCSDGAPPP